EIEPEKPIKSKKEPPPAEPPAMAQPIAPKPPPPAPQPSEEPKVAEVPEETVSEKKEAPPAIPPPPSAVNQTDSSVVSKPSEPKAPLQPKDLGRGGAQHQAIQQRIKHAAEEFGF